MNTLAEEQSRFLQVLAEDLNSREIALPSFPDVVIKIREALEDPACTPDRLSEVSKTDPVLVSRLLQSANSAFNNRAGVEIVDLNLAIGRLGFEAVRNTAIALAVEQIFEASQHEDLKELLREMWDRSLSLSSMSYVVARSRGTTNSDSAFLCGLFHEIGKLYILTKAKDFPDFLGDQTALSSVMDEWHSTVGKSILDAWGFPSEISDTLNDGESPGSAASSATGLGDVVRLSRILLEQDDDSVDLSLPEFSKLGIDENSLATVRESYELHSGSMKQSIGSA